MKIIKNSYAVFVMAATLIGTCQTSYPMHHLVYIMSAFREINDFMHRNVFYDSLVLNN